MKMKLNDHPDDFSHALSVGEQRKLMAVLVCSLVDTLGYWEAEPPYRRRKKVRAVKAMMDLFEM